MSNVDYSWAKKCIAFLLNGKKVVMLFEEDFNNESLMKASRKVQAAVSDLDITTILGDIQDKKEPV